MSQGEGFNGNSIKITMNATKDEKASPHWIQNMRKIFIFQRMNLI